MYFTVIVHQLLAVLHLDVFLMSTLIPHYLPDQSCGLSQIISSRLFMAAVPILNVIWELLYYQYSEWVALTKMNDWRFMVHNESTTWKQIDKKYPTSTHGKHNVMHWSLSTYLYYCDTFLLVLMLTKITQHTFVLLK